MGESLTGLPPDEAFAAAILEQCAKVIHCIPPVAWSGYAMTAGVQAPSPHQAHEHLNAAARLLYRAAPVAEQQPDALRRETRMVLDLLLADVAMDSEMRETVIRLRNKFA